MSFCLDSPPLLARFEHVPIRFWTGYCNIDCQWGFEKNDRLFSALFKKISFKDSLFLPFFSIILSRISFDDLTLCHNNGSASGTNYFKEWSQSLCVCFHCFYGVTEVCRFSKVSENALQCFQSSGTRSKIKGGRARSNLACPIYKCCKQWQSLSQSLHVNILTVSTCIVPVFLHTIDDSEIHWQRSSSQNTFIKQFQNSSSTME